MHYDTKTNRNQIVGEIFTTCGKHFDPWQSDKRILLFCKKIVFFVPERHTNLETAQSRFDYAVQYSEMTKKKYFLWMNLEFKSILDDPIKDHKQIQQLTSQDPIKIMYEAHIL